EENLRTSAGSMGQRSSSRWARRRSPRAHPEPGAPAGGIRLPIARAEMRPSRAAKGKRAPGATRSRAPADAGTACAEHGEDGEDATLPEASTVAPLTGAMGVTLTTFPGGAMGD